MPQSATKNAMKTKEKEIYTRSGSRAPTILLIQAALAKQHCQEPASQPAQHGSCVRFCMEALTRPADRYRLEIK